MNSLDRKLALDVYHEYRPSIEAADRADLEALVMVMLQQRSVDGLDGRMWNAELHIYFETAILSMIERIKTK